MDELSIDIERASSRVELSFKTMTRSSKDHESFSELENEGVSLNDVYTNR